MNNFAMAQAVQNKVKRKFYGHKTLHSKVVTIFPDGIILKSIHIFPIKGTKCPLTQTFPLPFPNRRLSPSAYPMRIVAIFASWSKTPFRPYPTVWKFHRPQTVHCIIMHLNLYIQQRVVALQFRQNGLHYGVDPGEIALHYGIVLLAGQRLHILAEQTMVVDRIVAQRVDIVAVDARGFEAFEFIRHIECRQRRTPHTRNAVEQWQLLFERGFYVAARSEI